MIRQTKTDAPPQLAGGGGLSWLAGLPEWLRSNLFRQSSSGRPTWRHILAGVLFIIGGAALAAIGGLFSIILAQILSGSVVGMHHLESVVGVAPLVAIPHIYIEAEKRARHRIRDRMILLGVLAAIVIACVTIYRFLF